jgi:hypothetical protein
MLLQSWESEWKYGTQDCYRGCFVGEKIVVELCAENGGGVVCEALFCELVYLRILRASDC